MRLHVFILVDLLALGFAVATLWLMYQGLQEHREAYHSTGDFLQDDIIMDTL